MDQEEKTYARRMDLDYLLEVGTLLADVVLIGAAAWAKRYYPADCWETRAINRALERFQDLPD